MPDRPSVLLLAPLGPARTGNGLAMRAGMLVEALTPVAAVHLVIVPISGAARAGVELGVRSLTVVGPVDDSTARDHVVRQMADLELRTALQHTAPLPARVTLAPPTLAEDIVSKLPSESRPVSAVLVFRSYLAPLGLRLGQLLGAPVVVDADEDDAAVLTSLGEHDEAEAFQRLVAYWLSRADGVLAAARGDADAIAQRAGRDRVDVVPNVVRARSVSRPPGDQRLLFVGNLTYEPNRRAVLELAEAILPRVRRACPAATLDVVGPLDDRLAAQLQGRPGIRVAGAVAGVVTWYSRADVVVAPLRQGGGTRLKVLEAFGMKRPLVATPAAVAGLDVVKDRDVVLADGPADFAAAIVGLLRQPERGEALTAHAAELVERRYGPDTVFPLVQAAVLDAARGPQVGDR